MMKESFTEILLNVSNSLLIPDILLLILFFALSIIQAGGFVSEYIFRLIGKPELKKLISSYEKSIIPAPEPQPDRIKFGIPAKVFRTYKNNPELGYSRILDNAQLDMEKSLSVLNLGVRLGPVLGLIGTLIPLGPALISMSQGDIGALAHNLIVSFSTTVLGLTVGGICYFIYTVRQSWYTRDINDLEFIFKKMTNEKD